MKKLVKITLSNIDLNQSNILRKDDMKQIMGGYEGATHRGYICSVNGQLNAFHCDNTMVKDDCLAACHTAWGTSCDCKSYS